MKSNILDKYVISVVLRRLMETKHKKARKLKHVKGAHVFADSATGVSGHHKILLVVDKQKIRYQNTINI